MNQSSNLFTPERKRELFLFSGIFLVGAALKHWGLLRDPRSTFSRPIPKWMAVRGRLEEIDRRDKPPDERQER